MKFARIAGFVVGALLSAESFAEEFTLAAVGGFGEPLTECRVESFQPTGRGVKRAADYKTRFRGLVAKNVPDGEYIAYVQCREARADSYVTVSNFHRFQVISESRRISRSDPPPSLLIRIDHSIPQGETWWLTAQALYRERSDTAKFLSAPSTAVIVDPDPGSYVITVLSSAGYSCIREIDIVERTRLWTFDPATCTFHLDEYAHLVTEEDKRERKTTAWYREMRKQEEEWWRALDGVVKANPDSN